MHNHIRKARDVRGLSVIVGTARLCLPALLLRSFVRVRPLKQYSESLVNSSLRWFIYPNIHLLARPCESDSPSPGGVTLQSGFTHSLPCPCRAVLVKIVILDLPFSLHKTVDAIAREGDPRQVAGSIIKDPPNNEGTRNLNVRFVTSLPALGGRTLNFSCRHTVAYFIATHNNYHVIYLFKVGTDTLRYLGERRILRWRATNQYNFV
ncbi:hypothetical protein J6590_007263 [Homalodisca vitripennis]|nr:hypothetical protein J6590_007263 [Homalodisca vitripennis]